MDRLAGVIERLAGIGAVRRQPGCRCRHEKTARPGGLARCCGLFEQTWVFCTSQEYAVCGAGHGFLRLECAVWESFCDARLR